MTEFARVEANKGGGEGAPFAMTRTERIAALTGAEVTAIARVKSLESAQTILDWKIGRNSRFAPGLSRVLREFHGAADAVWRMADLETRRMWVRRALQIEATLEQAEGVRSDAIMPA